MLTLSGPQQVSLGTTNQFTATLSGGPAIVGGVAIAVTQGTLDTIAGQSTKILDGEVVHSTPKQFSDGSVSWDFQWTAPSTGGTVEMYGAGNSADNSGNKTGDAGDGAVTYTITVQAENQPPVADADGPYSGTVGLPVSFDGSGSNDPDGTIVSYAWDFGDGNTGTGVSPTHTYAAAGPYTVSLTVTDDQGATDFDQTTATIEAAEEGIDYELRGMRVEKPKHNDQLTVPVHVRFKNVGLTNGPAQITLYLDDEFHSGPVTIIDETGNGPARNAELQVTFPGVGVFEVRVDLTDEVDPDNDVESLTKTVTIR